MSSPATTQAKRYQKVLEHPEHTAGVDTGTCTILEVKQLAPSMSRVSAALASPLPLSLWGGPNPAVRLSIPTPDGVVSRVYTVRALREISNGPVIDIDIVLHEGSSPMMGWLAALKPGDQVELLGPRPHFMPTFVDSTPVLLFADETAIPALATIIRDWPTGSPGFAWVESPDAEVVSDLPKHNDVQVTWLQRGAQPPGTTKALLSAAQRQASVTAKGSVWAAGEAGEMKEIRRFFRSELGLDPAQVRVFGYWRRSLSSTELDEQRLARFEAGLAAGRSMKEISEDEIE